MTDTDLDSMDDLIHIAKKRGFKVKENDELINESEFWPFQLLFNHDFAKALFGEDMVQWPILSRLELKPKKVMSYEDPYSIRCAPMWMYQIQQMAASDNPIEYARKNS